MGDKNKDNQNSVNVSKEHLGGDAVSSPHPALESCPFCGGEVSFGLIRINSPSPISNRDGVERLEGHFVNCQFCQANNNGIVHGYDTQEQAADAWNRREVQVSTLIGYEAGIREAQSETEAQVVKLVQQLVMLNKGGTVENLADAIIEDIGYGAHRTHNVPADKGIQ